MAIKKQSTSNYSIDSYEYFTNVENISPVPTTIKAYIPKYMPQITPGPWKKPLPISIGTLVNASDCSVAIPKKVMEQGYVTLGHYPNERPNFTSKATKINGELVVKKGTEFMAEVLYNDPTDIKFIGKV